MDIIAESTQIEPVTQEKRIFTMIRTILILCSSLLVTACTTVGGTFDDHLELRRLNQAHKLFSENEDEFLGNSKKYGERLDKLAIAMDQTMQTGLYNLRREALYKAVENLDNLDSAKDVKLYWKNHNFTINNIRKRKIYQYRPTLFTNVNADSEMLLRIADESRDRFSERLRMWDLSRKENVYTEFGTGVPLEEMKALFLDKLIQDMPALALLPESEITRVRTTYRYIWPKSIDLDQGRNVVATVLKDRAMRTGRVTVAEFHHSEKVANLLGVSVDIPTANIKYITEKIQSETPLIQNEESSNFKISSVNRRSAASSLSSVVDAPTVYILPQDVSISETILKSRLVTSSFKTGVVERANPTYIELAESITRMKSELLETEQNITSTSHTKEDVMDVADPRLSNGLKALVGLVAITAATGEAKNEFRADSLRHEIQTAQNRLSSTPRMIVTPKMSSYQFEALDVRAKRQERYTLAVHDMFSDTFDIYNIKLDRDDTHTVPKGIYDDDTKLSEYTKVEDYMAVIQEPLTINYDDFLAQMNPNSQGHVVSGVPRIELRKLILGISDGENKK